MDVIRTWQADLVLNFKLILLQGGAKEEDCSSSLPQCLAKHLQGNCVAVVPPPLWSHSWGGSCPTQLSSQQELGDNREDSLVSLYTAGRKGLLDSCWQAGRAIRMSQALQFKSSSGEPAMERSHLVLHSTSSANTTQLYLPFHSLQEACS